MYITQPKEGPNSRSAVADPGGGGEGRIRGGGGRGGGGGGGGQLAPPNRN